jgi:hypothetical protein
MKLSAWKHPKTGETRVYFNDFPTHGYEGKAFAVRDGEYFRIILTDRTYRSISDRVIGSIESALEDMNGGEMILKFDSLTELANHQR